VPVPANDGQGAKQHPCDGFKTAAENRAHQISGQYVLSLYAAQKGTKHIQKLTSIEHLLIFW
jgi:hypothetical protein